MSRIPAGSQTYSKARSQRSANSPTYAVRGDGASVLCSDGKRYTDWTAALGPIVLGYHNEKVDAAVKLAVELGPNFGLPTEYEERVAEQLVRVIPCAERVRFGKNGSDATSAAVRAARALTGRELIVSQGYHGWSLEVGGGPNKNGTVGNGLVDELMGRFGVFGWSANDLPAAIIVEPDAIEINSGNPSGTLEDLRKVCGKVGAVLIFDEVLTGFRLALGGAQQHYGVTPDLACFSKAMGNGYSISAIVGSERAMEPFDGGIGYSMTFSGETVGLAAAEATIRYMEEHPVVEHLWRLGRQLQDGWNAAAKRLDLDFPCEGNAPRTVINWRGNMSAKTLVQQEMWARGQMWTTGWTPTYAHTDADVERALDAADAALTILSEHRDNPAEVVVGPIVGEVFRR